MTRISHKKSALPHDALEFDFKGISEETKNRSNQISTLMKTLQITRNTQLLQPRLYAMDGGLQIHEATFEADAPDFFRRSRRCIRTGQQVHLRGTRYMISANPTFELRQKLLTFKEDLDEALRALSGPLNQVFQLAIADYIKNSVITMLNSFVHEEKQGKYRLEQVSYQAVRKEGQVYAQAAVDLYYGVFLQAPKLSSDAYRVLVDKRKIFDKMQEHILDEYKRGVFSSRHITRREASHPLTIAAAASHYAHFGDRKVQTVIGLPSGATELALAHATAQRLFNRQKVDVLLVPVSLHSSKDEFDGNNLQSSDLLRWMKNYQKSIHQRRVVLVDDNSSTGRTVEFVSDVLRHEQVSELDVAVSEADIIRSEIDLDNPSREKIADRSLYKYSVGVLAVSRAIKPKSDLKELYEKRKMRNCLRQRYSYEGADFPKRIIGAVYDDLLTTRTEDILSTVPDERIIRKFRKTFLSNFAPVKVYMDGKKFLSVEHAYQAMKFSSGVWSEISAADVDAINRKLESRRTQISLEDLPNLFVNPDISAGTSKIAANYLRILGYVRPDWDDVKVSIMLDLLLQKYANPEFYCQLQDTGEKYLIEGNDWDDTFWGECNGRGRNVLGRLLMEVRRFDHSSLIRMSRHFGQS